MMRIWSNLMIPTFIWKGASFGSSYLCVEFALILFLYLDVECVF